MKRVDLQGVAVRVVAALLLWLSIVAGAGAKPGGSQPLPLRVVPGDRFTVTVEKERVTVRNGKTAATPVVVSVFDGEYVEKRGNGYLLRWLLRETSVRGMEASAVQADALRLFNGIAFEVETDAAGVPLRLIDMPGTLARILAGLEKSGVKDEKAASYMKQMFASMDDKTAALTLFKEAATIAMFQNTKLAVGETRRLPALAPNPLGGPAIAMQQSLTLVQVNNNAKTARLRFVSRLEPRSLAVSMQAVMGKMLETVQDPARRAAMEKKLAASMQADKVVTADATVSVLDGWLRTLSMSEEISFAQEGETGTRTETTRIDIERLR